MEKEIEQEAWRLSDDVMDLLDDKAIDFIFSQGEKYLEELCKVSDSIMGRCYTLLGLVGWRVSVFRSRLSFCSRVYWRLYHVALNHETPRWLQQRKGSQRVDLRAIHGTL